MLLFLSIQQTYYISLSHLSRIITIQNLHCITFMEPGNLVFCDVTQCSLVRKHQCTDVCCIHLQNGKVILRNAGI